MLSDMPELARLDATGNVDVPEARSSDAAVTIRDMCNWVLDQSAYWVLAWIAVYAVVQLIGLWIALVKIRARDCR